MSAISEIGLMASSESMIVEFYFERLIPMQIREL